MFATQDSVGDTLGPVAILLVVAFFIGCAIFLDARKRSRLLKLKPSERPVPAVDAPISRFDCEEVGRGMHLQGPDNRCMDCGRMLPADYEESRR